MPLLVLNGHYHFLVAFFPLFFVSGTDRAEEGDYELFIFSENLVKYFRLDMVLLVEELLNFSELLLLIQF